MMSGINQMLGGIAGEFSPMTLSLRETQTNRTQLESQTARISPDMPSLRGTTSWVL
jgi:hypothetical protein